MKTVRNTLPSSVNLDVSSSEGPVDDAIFMLPGHQRCSEALDT